MLDKTLVNKTCTLTQYPEIVACLGYQESNLIQTNDSSDCIPPTKRLLFLIDTKIEFETCSGTKTTILPFYLSSGKVSEMAGSQVSTKNMLLPTTGIINLNGYMHRNISFYYESQITSLTRIIDYYLSKDPILEARSTELVYELKQKIETMDILNSDIYAKTDDILNYSIKYNLSWALQQWVVKCSFFGLQESSGPGHDSIYDFTHLSCLYLKLCEEIKKDNSGRNKNLERINKILHIKYNEYYEDSHLFDKINNLSNDKEVIGTILMNNDLFPLESNKVEDLIENIYNAEKFMAQFENNNVYPGNMGKICNNYFEYINDIFQVEIISQMETSQELNILNKITHEEVRYIANKKSNKDINKSIGVHNYFGINIGEISISESKELNKEYFKNFFYPLWKKLLEDGNYKESPVFLEQILEISCLIENYEHSGETLFDDLAPTYTDILMQLYINK